MNDSLKPATLHVHLDHDLYASSTRVSIQEQGLLEPHDRAADAVDNDGSL